MSFVLRPASCLLHQQHNEHEILVGLQGTCPDATTTEASDGAQLLLHQCQFPGSVASALVELSRLQDTPLAGAQSHHHCRPHHQHCHHPDPDSVSIDNTALSIQGERERKREGESESEAVGEGRSSS